VSKGLEVGKTMSLSLNNRLALRLRPFGPAAGVIPGRNGRVARFLMSLGATHYYDPSARLTNGQLMPNLIQLGADPAQLGSTPEPDSNDPVWLRPLPEASVWFPGTSSNSVNNKGFPGPNDLERVEITVDLPSGVDSINGSNDGLAQFTVSEYGSVGIGVVLEGFLVRARSTPASANDFSPVVPLPDGAGWADVRGARLTYHVGDKRSVLEVLIAGGAWQEMVDFTHDPMPSTISGDSVIVSAGRTSTWSAPSTSFRLGGVDYDFGGGYTAVFDPADLDGWSISRSATGLKTAIVPAGRGVLVTDGVDDFVQLPADGIPPVSATAGHFTMLLAMRNHAKQSAGQVLWDSRSTSASGIFLDCSSGGTSLRSAAFGAGGNSAYSALSGAIADDYTQPIVVGVRVSNGDLEVVGWSASAGLGKGTTVDISGVGAMPMLPPRIASQSYNTTRNWNSELLGYASGPVALSDAEIVAASKALLNGEITL